MTIVKSQVENKLTLALAGRLDTVTTPQLEAELGGIGPEVNEITLDFAELKYLSSSGLRIIVSLQKKLAGRGRMVIRNVAKPVMDVFEITGFTEVLTIE